MTHQSLFNRPMKFWELTSAFRDREAVILEVLNQDPWKKPYLAWYEAHNQLVQSQNRKILDAPVPEELTREIAKRCPDFFYFDPSSGNLRKDANSPELQSSATKMTLLEVHDQFGGGVIEEVLERGSLKIPDED